MAFQPHLIVVLALVVTLMASTSNAYSSRKSYRKPNNPNNPNKGMNVIDSCWRGRVNWESNRKALADCAIGFGKFAIGGQHGEIYIVTDPSDDPQFPRPGTLRHGAIQTNPLWIVFDKDMVIILRNELMISSFKTIDGRGADVNIAYGPCITIQHAHNVIVHGIGIHDCQPGHGGIVRDSETHEGTRQGSDGDAIVIFDSNNIWIDHCYFAYGEDGLIDVIHGSTAVTISNNNFTHHDKGHQDNFLQDKIMKVTVAFNSFGAGLNQRMPRVRTGYAHVANNMYQGWGSYAIGGSGDPTIFSEGNYFVANPSSKQVTKREVNGGWKWCSSRDKFENGAYFVTSGHGTCYPNYSGCQSFPVADGAMVPELTANAGPLICYKNRAC